MLTKATIVLMRASIAFIIVGVFFLSIQDFLIFPGALGGLMPWRRGQLARLPAGVLRHSVTTADNETLDVWELPPDPSVADNGLSMLIFHGNAGDVYNFFKYQQWGSRNGFRTFGFDYRGYGASSGWPTEHGLYRDSEALAGFLFDKDIANTQLVLVGISVGSGPAGYLSRKIAPKALVLFSPYTSIPDVAAELPLFGVLSSLVWTEFPVRQYVHELPGTCLIISHGQLDKTIVVEHSKLIAADHTSNPQFKLLLSETAGHNDILFKSHRQVADALNECIIG